MKIVTVNVPESYIEAIAKLVGNEGIYPSRSELIRVAVREFLLKELNMAENLTKYGQAKPDEEEYDDNKYVKIPVQQINDVGEKEYTGETKVYRIIKRLEH